MKDIDVHLSEKDFPGEALRFLKVVQRLASRPLSLAIHKRCCALSRGVVCGGRSGLFEDKRTELYSALALLMLFRRPGKAAIKK